MTNFKYSTYEGNCPIHGPYTLKYVEGYQYFFSCPECDKDKQIKQKYGVAYIPERFEKKTFDNFITKTEEQKNVVEQCRNYAQSIINQSSTKVGSLILAGNPGTGKTHLACAIANEVINSNREVLFMTVRQIINRVRATWKDSTETSEDVIRWLTHPTLLIIDEVGVQKGSDNEQQILFDVINARYNRFRPMIIITNEDLKGVEAYLGTRTYDRLCEDGKAIYFNWFSFRRQ